MTLMESLTNASSLTKNYRPMIDGDRSLLCRFATWLKFLKKPAEFDPVRRQQDEEAVSKLYGRKA